LIVYYIIANINKDTKEGSFEISLSFEIGEVLELRYTPASPFCEVSFISVLLTVLDWMDLHGSIFRAISPWKSKLIYIK
jgi:hypothetical protein